MKKLAVLIFLMSLSLPFFSQKKNSLGEYMVSEIAFYFVENGKVSENATMNYYFSYNKNNELLTYKKYFNGELLTKIERKKGGFTRKDFLYQNMIYIPNTYEFEYDINGNVNRLDVIAHHTDGTERKNTYNIELYGGVNKIKKWTLDETYFNKLGFAVKKNYGTVKRFFTYPLTGDVVFTPTLTHTDVPENRHFITRYYYSTIPCNINVDLASALYPIDNDLYDFYITRIIDMSSNSMLGEIAGKEFNYSFKEKNDEKIVTSVDCLERGIKNYVVKIKYVE